VIKQSVCDITITNERDIDAFDKDMHGKGLTIARAKAGWEGLQRFASEAMNRRPFGGTTSGVWVAFITAAKNVRHV
jgi:hypothetical protein